VQTKPTSTALTLRAEAAKTPQEAAKVYPGNYWLSMLEPPAKSEFPGTGNPPQGNGLGAAMDSQDRWVYSLKSDCNFCHQLGNQLTRTVDHVFKAKPELKTHAEAWEWRPRHRRARHLDVQRPQQPGSGAVAEGIRRLDRASGEGVKCQPSHRRVRKVSSAISC
jgi:hypothetical protein